MKMVEVQISITLEETEAKVLLNLLAPAIKTATVRQVDPAGEARIRASRHANFGGQSPPTDLGLLIDSREAAKLLGVSPRTLWKMQQTGEIPPPVRIGRSIRWSVERLKTWIEEGCSAEPNSQSGGPQDGSQSS